MQIIDRTQPKGENVVLDATNRETVMPVLKLLDQELKVHGLEFVITKEVLTNGSVAELVEVRKKKLTRMRKSKKQ